MNRSFDVHVQAVLSGTVTRTNIIGVRKAFNKYMQSLSRSSLGAKVKTGISEQEYCRMNDLFADHHPIIIGELHDSGLAMLKNKRYSKQLASVQHIIDSVERFTLVGFEWFGNYCVPVYRAHDDKGRSFPFYVVPWQSGGNGPTLASPNHF